MNNRFSVNLKRIIAVDSASFAYVEVPLDSNLVLLAKGNWGKTSIVNAVRFFLLPELNLNDCDKKFSFKTPESTTEQEYYTKDEVKNYYFQSVHSKLILEVEHKLIGGGARRHCQIISAGNNYKLNRLFIASPFEDIAHLFWDKSKGVSGGRPDSPPGENLFSALKDVNKTTALIRNTDELKKHLYNIDVLHPDECPFVIYPLHDLSKNSIESLRALVKLLFNQDGKSLQLMTATAIDSQDQGSQPLEVDVKQLINDHDRLEKERAELDQLKANIPAFQELTKEFAIQKVQQTHELEYAQLMINVDALRLHHEEKHRLQCQKVEPLKLAYTEADKVSKESKEALKINQHDISKSETELKQRELILEKCELICQPYPGLSTSEVLDALDEHLQERQEKLTQYADASARQIRLEELKGLIQQETDNLKKLKEREANQALAIKAQLAESEVRKLYAINPLLVNANPRRLLNEDEIQAISKFLQLFTLNAAHLQFFDENIPLSTYTAERSISEQIFDCDAQRISYISEEKELLRLNDNPTLHNASEISKVEREITLTQSDVETLKSFELSFQRKKEVQEELEKLNKIKAVKDIEKERNLKDLENSQQAYEKAELEREIAAGLCLQISRLNNSIKSDCLRFPRVQHLTESLRPTDSPENIQLPLPEELQTYAQKLERSKDARERVYTQLVQFCIKGIIKDEHGIMENNRSQAAISKSFDTLSIKFQILDQSQSQLEKDTALHNSYLRNRLERLDKTKIKIEQTVQRINEELANATINDLEAVKLKVVLNGSFDDLVLSWREFDDLNTVATLPASWYARLQEFLHSDAVNSLDGKLRMENIIKQASYMTKKPGEMWDEKAQSTSTQILINMHFAEIFIQRLCDNISAISFPLILDEVGTVSAEQIPPLIRILNEKGHTLIGATTHGKSADLIDAFGQYLFMDEMSTAEPYDQKRVKTCFSPEQEFIRRHSTQLAFVEA
ncbi:MULTISPECIES: hypothetical protein [Vibrio]|nr:MULTISPECIES: hypothetical protein [Vibrio]HDZ9326788.1 hypothetical protein [Vibrio cholerae]MBF4256995.1 hypothetical protein [Vibrio anguillarum]MBF4279025.1 hypothetical protein [Vibrio anguillarum]MBF4299402.1 hypothetical protein [Vibrio anguillarum]MBF4364083.1 hypothetical protein [Vibrio anguillarum]